jgi:trigger factor
MQATVETLSNLERRMTVSVPMKPIEEEVGQRLGRLARTVKMPGFRPGHVPMNLVQKNYGSQVFNEVISSTVERTFSEAVTENKLRVAGYPNIEQKPSADTPGNFEYVATFEIFPEVTVGDLASVAIERPKVKITKANVDRTISVLQKQRASYEPVKRAAKEGDKVSVMFRAEIDGQEVESTNGKSIDLILGEDGRVAEFDENLVGLTTGESKKFDIAYPEDNPNPQLSGKTVSYEVTATAVEKVKLPKVDEDFAKGLGIENGDVEKMRADIEENLEQEVAKRVSARLKEQVFKGLLENVSVELPRALISMETNRLIQAMGADLQKRGVDLSQVNLEPGMFEEQAKRNVQLRLVLAELVNKNELHAKPEQVRAVVDGYAKSFEQPEEVVRWYYADPQRLDEPVGIATEENVVNWVMERAKVSDKTVSFDELMGAA